MHRRGGIKGSLIGRLADRELIRQRFPAVETFTSGVIFHNGSGSVYKFTDKFRAYSYSDCLLLNTKETIVRCKSILYMDIVASAINEEEIKKFKTWVFSSNTYGAIGIHQIFGNYTEAIALAGHLQSLYLFPKLRETTIGEFIRLHPQLIKQAFQTDHFIYEPYLEWIEHDGTVEDKAINPDLLIRRKDGDYDIYDLKKALLDAKSVTTGPRNRRQFIHDVRDGIAQLGNYREYFQYPANAAHALEKYGVTVKSPKLVLVIGSFENVDIAEVAQASRMTPDIELVDYDTLCSLFLQAERNAQAEAQ